METREVTADTVAIIDDVDVLWDALTEARERGDDELKSAIRGRMGELQEQRRFAHLTDEELKAQIAALARQHDGDERVEQLPAWDEVGAGGVEHVAAINEGIRANADDNVETTLRALTDEWHRRHGDAT